MAAAHEMEALNLKYSTTEAAAVSPDFSDFLTTIFPYRQRKWTRSASAFSELLQQLAAFPSHSQALCCWMTLGTDVLFLKTQIALPILPTIKTFRVWMIAEAASMWRYSLWMTETLIPWVEHCKNYLVRIHRDTSVAYLGSRKLCELLFFLDSYEVLSLVFCTLKCCCYWKNMNVIDKVRFLYDYFLAILGTKLYKLYGQIIYSIYLGK